MAFVAEDGTGLANANALTTLAFADSYFEDRGNAAWTGTDDAKEQAIIRATDFVEARWTGRFRGVAQFPDTPQALSFPRLYINNDGAVPYPVQQAIAEYALRALTAALAPDPVVALGQQLSSVRKKVGPIETEFSYGAGSAPFKFPPYPLADAMLRPYLLSAGIVRA